MCRKGGAGMGPKVPGMEISQVQDDQLAISILRGLALELPRQANSGHTGTAMALAPLGWLLYSKVLRHNPSNPQWANRDRLILSSGHACVLLYGLLHLCGYDLSLEDLKGFRKSLPYRTPGHPETWITPGIDFSTGPLGQGLAAGVGMAWAERILSEKFSGLVDHYTYVICSDGDLMEGVTSEASSLAGHQKLGKLIVFYDNNCVTIDGPTQLSFSEDVAARYASYGWHVLNLDDGEDLMALEQAIEQAQADPRPSLLCVKTIIGFPAPTLQGTSAAHSPAFPDTEISVTKKLLGIPFEPAVWVDSEAQQRWSQLCLERGRELEKCWNEALASSPQSNEWANWHQRRLSDEFSFPEPQSSGPMATRIASGLCLKQIEGQLPQMLVGSADLAGSTLVQLNSPERNLHFGVREQAMAAICSGMVCHGGVVTVCSTYFAFSDQMKPALRLAALAGIPTISVFTHDSLALGEDGPTHQPVEQLATLRALPNFLVLRPADLSETQAAWRIAVNATCPVALILSRQALPYRLSRSTVEQGFNRGGYLVQETPDPLATLIGTGSELHLCLRASEILAEQGIGVRVVSLLDMPIEK